MQQQYSLVMHWAGAAACFKSFHSSACCQRALAVTVTASWAGFSACWLVCVGIAVFLVRVCEIYKYNIKVYLSLSPQVMHFGTLP